MHRIEVAEAKIKSLRVFWKRNDLDFRGVLGCRHGEAEHVGEYRRGESKDEFGDAEVHVIAGL
jgi:hypothetical protein